MRQMPKRFTRRWWTLWRSGAIPRDVVFFDYLAELYQQRKQERGSDYYNGDIESIRRGKRQIQCRGLLDLCGVACIKLQLSEKVYTKLTKQLFGYSAYEVEQAVKEGITVIFQPIY